MPAGENVEYVISLKDLFTGKLAEADAKAKAFELTMGQVGSAIAGAFAVGAISNFISTSVAAFSEAEKASAQLTASLKSTGAESWTTKAALDAQALSLMRLSTFDDDAITGSQSLLLTFTNIRGEIFDRTMPAIVDLATKMGGDLQGATIQLGKALQDPTTGMTALTRSGVSFSQQQKEVIKNMQETGNLAGAQTLILEELNRQFGGSAAAAAGTYSGQMAILNHEFMNVKEEIGGMVAALLIKLKPVLEDVVSGLKNGVEWLKEHEDAIKAGAVAVGVFAAAWTAYLLPSALATAATFLMEGAFWALSVAMTANPIGLVIAGLAALAGAFYYAWQRSETFRGVILGVWGVLKGLFSFIMNTGSGVGQVLSGIFNRDPEQIAEGVGNIKKAWQNLDVEGDYNKGFMSAASAAAQGPGPAGKMVPKGMAPTAPGMTPTKAPGASSVTGQKSYVVNISIGDLIKEFTVQTTTMVEGSAKVKELVTQSLLSAVNDSQIIAER